MLAEAVRPEHKLGLNLAERFRLGKKLKAWSSTIPASSWVWEGRQVGGGEIVLSVLIDEAHFSVERHCGSLDL